MLGHGDTTGRTRIYRQAYFEHPNYVPLLKRSLALWIELNAYYRSNVRPTLVNCDGLSDSPLNLLELCGGIMIGRPDSEVITGTLQSIRAHSLPHEIWNSAEMTDRHPVFQLSDDEIAVYESNAGYLFSELCIQSYIYMAKECGAALHFNETMLSWQQQDTPQEEAGCCPLVAVQTTKGSYLARKLVLTVGAWATSIYASRLPFSLTIERRVLYWFEPDSDRVAEYKVTPIYILSRWVAMMIHHLMALPLYSVFPSTSGTLATRVTSTGSPWSRSMQTR